MEEWCQVEIYVKQTMKGQESLTGTPASLCWLLSKHQTGAVSPKRSSVLFWALHNLKMVSVHRVVLPDNLYSHAYMQRYGCKEDKNRGDVSFLVLCHTYKAHH